MPDVKSSRAEKAAATRRRMLDAAYELFCEPGFPATTMAAIAERAGVAVQTLYFTFHTKDELLQEVLDRAVVGEDRVPPPAQDWHRATVAEPVPELAVRHLVAGIAGILARVAPLVPTLHAVAAEPAGQVHARSEELRVAGMRDLVDALRRKQPLRRGLTAARATDLLVVLLSPETYRSFVLERGWSQREWVDWTAGALARALYG